MTSAEYTTYFEQVATNLRAIGHTAETPRFARMKLEQLMTKRAADLAIGDQPGLILENYDGEVSDNGADQQFDQRRCAFLIVQECGLDDRGAEEAAADLCEALGKKIFDRMKKDVWANNDPLPGYDPKTPYSYHRVAGLFDNAHGARFEFTISEATAVQVEAADWLDA